MDDEDEDVEGVQVDFVEVTAVLDEDDGLQFRLPKHHRRACHLNLVSTVDAAKACSSDPYKNLSRSTFSKGHALWNMCGRSTAATEIIEDMCKVQLIRPNATRLSPVEIAFLEKYTRTMSPVAKALNILQAEIDVQMGWLLPTLTLLISKLGRIRITSRYCKPLVDAF
ncbi:hypothetical protein AOLI_G00286470 [Acnodon oligacanthus]